MNWNTCCSTNSLWRMSSFSSSVELARKGSCPWIIPYRTTPAAQISAGRKDRAWAWGTRWNSSVKIKLPWFKSISSGAANMGLPTDLFKVVSSLLKSLLIPKSAIFNWSYLSNSYNSIRNTSFEKKQRYQVIGFDIAMGDSIFMDCGKVWTTVRGSIWTYDIQVQARVDKNTAVPFVPPLYQNYGSMKSVG